MQRGLDKLESGSKIYFIGIGGISMSGLALLAQGYGFKVGGSDMNPSERTEMLKEGKRDTPFCLYLFVSTKT